LENELLKVNSDNPMRDEIKKVIMILSSGKYAGSYGIPTELIKNRYKKQ